MTEQDMERGFFENLGRAIGKWQLVEMHLFRVCARLMRCEDPIIGTAAFHAIGGFRNRINLTNAAAVAEHAASPDTFEFEKWVRLKKRTIELAEIRNRLAHSTVYYVVTMGEISADEAGPWLRRNHFDPKQKGTENQLGAKDISNAAKSFDNLAGDMRSFANALPAPPGSPSLV